MVVLRMDEDLRYQDNEFFCSLSRYLTYGEAEWRNKTEDALAKMETYDPVVRHAFEHTLGWLEQWACSRSFGLGTKLPWDPEFLIESLSDSTIYMAYYTIAHILQEGDMFGERHGAIKPAEMTHVRASGHHCLLCVLPSNLIT